MVLVMECMVEFLIQTEQRIRTNSQLILTQLITNGLEMLKFLMTIHLLLPGAVGNKMEMMAEFMFKDSTLRV